MKKHYSKLIVSCLTATLGIGTMPITQSLIPANQIIEKVNALGATGWGIVGIVTSVICTGVSIGVTQGTSKQGKMLKKLDQMIDLLNEINVKVDQINNKLNDISSTLENEFGKIGVSFSQAAIQTDISIIASFNASSYQQYMTQLDTTMNSMFVAFGSEGYSHPENYIFDSGYMIDVVGITGENVVIPGSDVADAIAHSRAFDINDIEGWCKEVFKYIINSYIDSPDSKTILESTGLKDALLKRRKYGFSDDTFADAFAEGFYDYLYENFYKDICMSKEIDSTYVGNVINSFLESCDSYSSSYSPLLCQFDIFKNAFCFQGDGNYINSNGEKRSIIVDSGLLAILNLAKFALFTAQVCGYSGFVSDKTINDIDNRFTTAANIMYSEIQSMFKVDKNQVPLDKYCYRTKSVVDLNFTTVKTDSSNPFYAKVGLSNHAYVDEDGHDFSTTPSINRLSKTPLTGIDLSYLSTLCKNVTSTFTGVSSFRDYLNKYFPDLCNSNLVTEVGQFESFKASETGYLMNVYQFGLNSDGHLIANNRDVETLGDHTMILGDWGYNSSKWKLDDNSFIDPKVLKGSYFDVDLGTNVDDAALYAYSYYYHYNKNNNDDVAWFSLNTIAGADNSPIINSKTVVPNLFTYPYKDYASSIEASHIYDYSTDHGYQWTNFYIDLDVNLASLVIKNDVEYGVWSIDSANLTQYFDQYELSMINYSIDKVNQTIPEGQNKIPEYGIINNDSKYWIQYDLEKYFDSSYSFAEYASDEARIKKYANEYVRFSEYLSNHYAALNENPSEIGSQYINIDMSPEETTYTLDNLKKSLSVMQGAGKSINGVVLPDEFATDVCFAVKVNPQIGEELTKDAANATRDKLIPTYVTVPVLSYKENGNRKIYELPSETSFIFDLMDKDITLNLPLCEEYKGDNGKNSAAFTFNQFVSSYGVNSDRNMIAELKNDATHGEYISVTLPSFGAYSYLGNTDNEFIEYEKIDGLEPDCGHSGYLAAYKSGETYYSKPGEVIGDETAYSEWIRYGGGGYLGPSTCSSQYISTYTFDEANKRFIFTVTCPDCGRKYQNSCYGTYVKDVDATCENDEMGHYIGSASVNYDGGIVIYCTASTEECTAIKVGTKLPHEFIHHDKVNPTCIDNGCEENYECKNCGNHFTIDGQIKFDPTIPATGHHLDEVPYVAPTPETDGNIHHYECHDCHQYFADPEGLFKINKTDTIIPATGYTYELIERVDGSHGKSGHQQCYYSPEKDKYYLDDKGVSEITNYEEWISEGGAGYIAPVPCTFGGQVSYVINGNICTASMQCIEPGCNLSLSENAEIKYVIDTPATCTHNAYGHLEAVFANPDFDKYSTPTNSYEFKDTKLKHDIDQSSVRYVWNEDNDICTAIITCNDCGQTLPIVGESKLVIDTPATCTNDAVGHYEATFPGQQLEKQIGSQFTIEGTAHGHHYENGVCEDCGVNDPNYVKPQTLSNGAVVGICVGCSFVAVILTSVLQFIILKKKKKL